MDRKEIDNDIKTAEDVSLETEAAPAIPQEENKESDVSSSDLLKRLKANLAELADVGVEDLPDAAAESAVIGEDGPEIKKLPPAVVTPTGSIRYYYRKMSRAENENRKRRLTEAAKQPDAAVSAGKAPKTPGLFAGIFGKKTDSPAADINEEISEADPDLVKAFDAAAADETEGGELDKTDEQLMVALGMEEELKQKVGEEKAREIDAEVELKAQQAESIIAEMTSDNRSKFEYVAPQQVKGIFAYYRACYRGLIWRVAVVILLMIGAFVHENIGLFGGSLPKALDAATYPVIHILVGMQFLVLAAALIWKPLYHSLRSMIQAKPEPESLTLAVVAVSLIYEIVMCFIYGYLPANTVVRTFNFAAIATILMTLIYELMNVQREIYSFNVAASKKDKYVIARLEGEDEDTKRENELFADSLGGTGEMFCVRQASFINDFFKRINTRPSYYKTLNYLIPAALAVGLVMFVYGLLSPFSRQGAAASFMGGYAAIMMVLPIAGLFNYSYPFYKASKAAFSNGSTIVGESSLDEYSVGSAISFDDREVFPADRVKIKTIQVVGHMSIDSAIYYASKIFGKTGGPLDDALRSMTQGYQVETRGELLEIAEDGINAVIDGSHVLIGRGEYMTANGIRPINPEEDEEIESGGEVCVMYMAVNDAIAAKFKIQYIIDDDFESILQQLSRAGMCVGIRTFDPNINDRMLSARVRTMRYPVRVIKCRTTENRGKVYDHYSSGILSRSSVRELLMAQIYCDRVLHTIRTNTAVKIFAMAVGAAITALVISLGLIGSLNSLEVALFQFFWLIPMAIVSRLLI
ncbi:MAG: hypothetical protein ACOX4O_06150 [Eubacteriales bacterium]|jgi:hypothetical protein